MDDNDEIIKQNILNREILFEIILTAVFISFGTNLIVNSLLNINNLINEIVFITGIIIVLGSSIFLIYTNFKKFDRSVLIKGFIIYNSKDNELIDIDEYELSRDLISNLNAAFKEDKSLKKIWDTIPLKKVFEFSVKEGSFNRKKYKTSSKELIEELFEYIFLDTLSTTLTDFFNKKEFEEKNLIKYERDDIPDVLLKNRFLDLFSKPMEQREFFVEDYLNDEDDFSSTVLAQGRNGVLYKKFDLVLPKNTRIQRLGHHKIRLESDQMTMTFKIIFQGCGTVLPSDFEKYYLGLNFEPAKFKEYELSLKIDIKFKIQSLFSYNGWNYHKWLDQYLKTLNRNNSMKHFFKSINWNQTRALFYMIEKRKKSDKKSDQ